VSPLRRYTPEPRFSPLWFVAGIIPLALVAVLIFIFLPKKPPLELLGVLPGEARPGQSVLLVGTRLDLTTRLMMTRNGNVVEVTPIPLEEARFSIAVPNIEPGEYALSLRMEDREVATDRTLEVVSAYPVASATPAPAPAPTAAPGDAVRTVEVLTAQPWTDTGITVGVGDTIFIQVSGSVIYDDLHPESLTGPEGTDSRSGGCNYVVTDRSVPAQSVIGNVARWPVLDGTGFYVGPAFEGSVPIENTSERSGKLYLGFNDGAVYCDRRGYDAWGFRGENEGTFIARVSVTQ